MYIYIYIYIYVSVPSSAPPPPGGGGGGGGAPPPPPPAGWKTSSDPLRGEGSRPPPLSGSDIICFSFLFFRVPGHERDIVYRIHTHTYIYVHIYMRYRDEYIYIYTHIHNGRNDLYKGGCWPIIYTSGGPWCPMMAGGTFLKLVLCIKLIQTRF